MNLFSKIPDVVKVGLWGPPGSGKTTYITMLAYADLQGWRFVPRGNETLDLYLEYSELLRDKKEFIPPTFVDKVFYLSFDLESPKGFFRKKSFRVLLPEASGEYYERPDMHPDFIQEFYRFQGIIWLIDPERIDNPHPNSRSYRRMIQEWLYRLYELQGGGVLNHHMAFCLTKMDLPDYYKHIDDPRNFCLDKLGSDIEKILGSYCDPSKVNFFATSSIGLLPDTEKSARDPNDSSKLIASATPINLFSPFRWMFDSLG